MRGLIKKLHSVSILRKALKPLGKYFTVRQRFHNGYIFLNAVDHSWAWLGNTNYESFDRDLQDTLLSKSRDKELFIDIGANIGAMTLSLLLRNPTIKALCIEPNPTAAALIRKNAIKNGLTQRITIHKLICASHNNGEYFNPEGSVIGHVVGEGDTNGSKIESINFADLINKASDQYDAILIKVDVEGFETNFIHTIKDVNRKENLEFVMELHPKGFNLVGDPRYCLEVLEENGFQCWDINGVSIDMGNLVETNFHQITCKIK